MVMTSTSSRLTKHSNRSAVARAGIVLGALAFACACTTDNGDDATEQTTTSVAPPTPTGVLPGDPGVFDPSVDGNGKGNGPNPNTVISANPVDCNGVDEAYSGDLQSCYRLVSIPALSWAQASIDCTLWSAGLGHLVSVASAGEDEFLRTFVGGAQVWLGASDAKIEGDWRWLSGETWFYQNFGSGRPDNQGRSEHCLSLGSDGLWDDVACERELPYVCERSFAQ